MARLSSSLTRAYKYEECVLTRHAHPRVPPSSEQFSSISRIPSPLPMDTNSKEFSGASSLHPTKLQLYSYWQSSCSWRVRFALNLKGLSYEYKAVDLSKGEQFSPEFKRLNPICFVPVLVDGDLVVSDSLAILLYLEEKYPQNSLLPVYIKRRSLNLQVFISYDGDQLGCEYRWLEHSTSSDAKYLEEKLSPEDRLLWAEHYIVKGFNALENLLEDSAGKYATGDEVYMADVFLAPQISVATSRFNIDMSRFPTLNRVNEAYKVLPAFQASLPERQPDAKIL